MFLSKATIIVSVAIFGSVQVKGQCPSSDNGQCDFEPVNPYTCGEDSCAYENRCLASAAGFDVDTECCQAPQPSVCPMNFDPQICGTLQCSYSNECIANLAGYSADQCESPPPECPAGTKDCSGDPANPYTCGASRCPYNTICELQDAGFDLEDCCQDVRTEGPCTADLNMVSCGAPGGKQCTFDNQCNADASGYNEKQCCPAAGDVVCTMDFAPVECGVCVYSNQCMADAAGQTGCCRQPSPDVACTMDNKPVLCGECVYSNQCVADSASQSGCCPMPAENAAVTMDIQPVTCGDDGCTYDNLSIGKAAGFTDDECCRKPADGVACTLNIDPVTCDGCTFDNQCIADSAGYSESECCAAPVTDSCTQNYAPMMCSSASCVYDNDCIAEASGMDPNSCVPYTPPEPEPMAEPVSNDVGTLSDTSSGVNATIGLLATASIAVLGMLM